MVKDILESMHERISPGIYRASLMAVRQGDLKNEKIEKLLNKYNNLTSFKRSDQPFEVKKDSLYYKQKLYYSV